MALEKPKKPSFAPRHWVSWLLVSLHWLLAWLPQRLGLLLVSPLGPLAYRFSHRRRKIAETNLIRCFPDWSEEKREEVLRESFRSTMRMIVETSWCWAGPRSRMQKIIKTHGVENLLKPLNRGQSALVVTGHSTCLEISGFALGMAGIQHSPDTFRASIYRRLKNPVMEWYQTSRRETYASAMIEKRKVREVLRLLKGGSFVWYAPDQDFGPEQSAFAPFFGIETASLLATHRLPKLSGCAVVPMYPIYRPETRTYDVYFLPELENFPTDDPVADLTRVNKIIEEQVRKAPEQYWWIHRRFKTRPDGEPPFYGS
jgi:KDO2-lipid IV(A) lauroyltransferase